MSVSYMEERIKMYWVIFLVLPLLPWFLLRNAMKWVLLSFSFYDWEDWGCKQLKSFSLAAKLEGNGASSKPVFFLLSSVHTGPLLWVSRVEAKDRNREHIKKDEESRDSEEASLNNTLEKVLRKKRSVGSSQEREEKEQKAQPPAFGWWKVLNELGLLPGS